MAYEAKVFRVLIAFPSDVIEEREITVKTIQEWNDLNSHERQIVLLPLRWETHTSPQYGKRPQEIINKQIVDHCDLLIGIFWTRIGSPTGEKDSGTLEEIERVVESNKPVMLYFSKIKKEPDEIDLEQLSKLRDFKKNTYEKALVENFSSQIEFRDKLTKHIELELRKLIDDGSKGGSLISNIILEFYDLKRKKNLGTNYILDIKHLELNNFDKIPDYKSNNKEKEQFPWFEENSDYYRDYAKYYMNKTSFTAFDFWLSNIGMLGAKDLYIDMVISTDSEGVKLFSNSKFDIEKPSKDNNSDFKFNIENSRDNIIVTPNENKKEWKVSFELNALQPKREICPNSILNISASKSAEINIVAQIYADSLPEPITHNLKIKLNVENIIEDSCDFLRKMKILEK